MLIYCSTGQVLVQVMKGHFPENTPLPLKSTSDVDFSNKKLWRLCTANSAPHVGLYRTLVCSINAMDAEHNEPVLSMLPDRPFKLRPVQGLSRYA